MAGFFSLGMLIFGLSLFWPAGEPGLCFVAPPCPVAVPEASEEQPLLRCPLGLHCAQRVSEWLVRPAAPAAPLFPGKGW